VYEELMEFPIKEPIIAGQVAALMFNAHLVEQTEMPTFKGHVRDQRAIQVCDLPQETPIQGSLIIILQGIQVFVPPEGSRMLVIPRVPDPAFSDPQVGHPAVQRREVPAVQIRDVPEAQTKKIEADIDLPLILPCINRYFLLCQ
jgi:hypothetical protein